MNNESQKEVRAITLLYQQNLQLPYALYYPVAISDLTNSERCSSIEGKGSFIIVTSGTCMLYINGEHIMLKSGSIAHFETMQAIRFIQKTQLVGICIHYESFTNNESELFSFPHGVITEQASSSFMLLSEQLLAQWRLQQERVPFSVQQLFMNVLVEIYHYLQLSEKSHKESSEAWLQKTLQYIRKHYHTPITRSSIAELAGVSPEHFSRVFRKEMGQTYSSYLNLLRIRKAQQLLLTKSLSLSQIAPELGYEEATYLSRKFKQIVGISPTIFVRKEKRIVSLNYNYTACLRALDIMPEIAPYTQWLASRERIQPTKQLTIQHMNWQAARKAVSDVNPDVIFNYCIDKENDVMLPIAPVIAIPFQRMDWKDQFRLISEVVDRKQQADQWLSTYNERSMKLYNKLDYYRGTAIVWELNDKTAYCFDASYGRGCHILYGELNYQIPDQLIYEKINEKGYLEKQIEEITLYPADHIIFINLPTSVEGKRRLDQLMSSESWLSLDAVHNNQVYFLNQSDMFYGFDPISSLAQLDILSQILIS